MATACDADPVELQAAPGQQQVVRLPTFHNSLPYPVYRIGVSSYLPRARFRLLEGWPSANLKSVTASSTGTEAPHTLWDASNFPEVSKPSLDGVSRGDRGCFPSFIWLAAG